MVNEEEWETILMRRESEIHSKKVEKAVLRDAMLRIKNEGYSNVSKADAPLLKVFMGYLSGLKMFHNPSVLDAVCLSVARETVVPRARKIMERRLDSAEQIIKTLQEA